MSILQVSHYERALEQMRQDVASGIVALAIGEPEYRRAYLKGRHDAIVECAEKYREMDRNDLDKDL